MAGPRILPHRARRQRPRPPSTRAPGGVHDAGSMLLNRVALALLLLAAPPLATADGRFAALRDHAQRLDSLGPFLERYVGSCRDAFTRADCEQNVRRVRRGLTGSVFSASVAEQTLDLVKPHRTRSGYRFVVTPFIDGGGLALTNGEPHSQDAAGHPL